MLIDVLNERACVLREEFTRARQSLVNLTEQLEQAKTHLAVVSGHLTEVTYLIGEEQRLTPVAPIQPEAPVQGEEQNGQVNDEAEGQTPQE